MTPEVLLNKKLHGEKAINLFRKTYFWDCDYDNILLGEDFEFIIERVLSRSSNLSEDLPILDKIYPENLIKDIAIEKSNLIIGNEQIEQIASHYDLNPNHFSRFFK